MFAIVDIETCGPKYAFQKGRIIDICIVVHDGLQVVDKFSTLINPECTIGSFYTSLSGISNEMVQDAPKFHEVAKEILHYTEGKIFVAHNASFDYNFIKDEFASLGYKFKRDTLCTVRLSRKLMPGKKSYSLGNLCASLGIENTARHRAEGDAVATTQLLDLLLQLKTQSAQYKTASLNQIMTSRIDNIKKYILDKLPSSTGVYYFLNKNQQIIYIGKSIDMYQRAVSHFNSDLKKTKQLLHELTNVDFVETGSELIALLLESEEIKKHKPIYNTARKKDTFTHCIDLIEKDKIQSFQIVPLENSVNSILSFTSYAAAREKLEFWIQENSLCLKYCGLTTEESVCFHHQIKKCNGICAGLETAADYNLRVNQVIKNNSFQADTFLVFDKGRQAGERAFIMVENRRYIGYGYFDEYAAIADTEELKSYLENKKYYPDANDILRGWLSQKRREVKVIK
ncbi:MAG: GIY-YIG nuclease family protein [Bacteroidetes bacterium]|jgi:DNA polymerase-3 subunit epsilon|nr:GIY-YIG nuclease family protein [Bacteroidota bacterium]MBK9300831.1 GIY-YIG nuclease family protein [Bacteroidota bacterium]